MPREVSQVPITRQQRERELQGLNYTQVKKICTTLRLPIDGGKAMMIPRILATEFREPEVQGAEVSEVLIEEPMNSVPPIQRNAINKEREEEFWRMMQVQTDKMEERLKSIEKGLTNQESINQYFLDSIGGNQDKPGATQGIASKVAPAEKFWPEKRLRNFDFQEEYDEQIRIGRMVSGIKQAFPLVQGLEAFIKPLESIIALKAAKVRVADADGVEVARGLVAKEEGTFMEQFEPRIERLKKNLGSRKPFKTYDPVFDKKELPSRKRGLEESFEATCYACGKKGHKKSSCPDTKRLKLGNGQSAEKVIT